MSTTNDRRVGPPPPYDAECGAVLGQFPPFPPLTLDAIPGMRAAADQFMPRPTDEVLSRGGAYTVEERTVPGPAGAPDIALVICRPTGTPAAVPALYNVHGGGMVGGTARDALTEMLDLAAAMDGAIVSVEYRLAPETPHPGPVEDCYAGLVWTAAHAPELGLDPDRLVVTGNSAGAGIAAALALMARDRGGPAIAGQLLIYPMLDDRNDTPSAYQMAELGMWNRAENEVGWTALLGDARGGPDVPAYAAPARADDLSGLPPAYVDVGSADTFRDEDVAYASLIWQAGGEAELHVWPGGYHGFDGIAPHAAIAKAAWAARAGWLRRLVATDRST